MITKQMRVADFITQFFVDLGVEHICYLPGAGIMFLTDSLVLNKKVRSICFLHEQAAAMALEAYARTNGRLGVGYFTTGPGAINALTGTAGAYLDSVPSIFVSGDVKQRETTYKLKIPGLRQCGTQEINIFPMVDSITKYAFFVDDPQKIKYHLEKAVFLAKNGRPGPSWLIIPLDVQAALIEPKKLVGFKQTEVKKTVSQKDIVTFLKFLKKAKRPVILAGYGVRIAGAQKQLKQLAKELAIPIVTTFLGIDVIEENHPCYIGRIGIRGTRAGNLAIQNSDLLLVIGSSLPIVEIGYEYDAFAREAKKIVVDIDPCSHKKRMIKIDQLIEADAKYFIEKLTKTLTNKKSENPKKWLKICREWKKKYPVCLPEYRNRKNKVNMYLLVEELSNFLRSGDVVVSDAGTIFYIASQGIKIKKGVRYITSGGFATMGYSLPASIGVSLALNRKRVFCLTGDGSFQQNIQELQTTIHYRLPVKVFVINNKGYLSIRNTSKKFFKGRLIGEGPKSGLSFPATRKIAKAYRIKYVGIKNNKQLKQGIKETLKYRGPVICEVFTPENQIVKPALSSIKLKDGTMISRPLEDMYPFLPRKEFLSNMIVKPYEFKKK